ncbi:MAG: DUF1304 domain-containing protein [Formosimonas sp.]
MQSIAMLVTGFVAFFHIYVMCLEMFMWNTPKGHKTFGLTPELAEASKTLAANQGLYNGFLAAGLIWGLWQGNAGLSIQVFFLLCVIVAGIFGGLTVSKRIFVVQALPAMLALILLWLAQ